MTKSKFNSKVRNNVFNIFTGQVFYFDFDDNKNCIIVGDAMQVANGFGIFEIPYNDDMDIDDNICNMIYFVEKTYDI